MFFVVVVFTEISHCEFQGELGNWTLSGILAKLEEGELSYKNKFVDDYNGHGKLLLILILCVTIKKPSEITQRGYHRVFYILPVRLALIVT